MKLLGWFFFSFSFFLVDLSLWHGFLTVFCCEFHWWLVWVCEQPLCQDFFVKFASLSEDFAEEREIWRKERLWLPQCCSSLQRFRKVREMGREERKRENVFLLFCWRVGLGLTGVKHTFYASFWPNLISFKKHNFFFSLILSKNVS